MTVAAVVGALALDFGGLARQMLLVLVVYVAMAITVISRRRFAPKPGELFLVKYGFGLLAIIVLSLDILIPDFLAWFQRTRR